MPRQTDGRTGETRDAAYSRTNMKLAVHGTGHKHMRYHPTSVVLIIVYWQVRSWACVVMMPQFKRTRL